MRRLGLVRQQRNVAEHVKAVLTVSNVAIHVSNPPDPALPKLASDLSGLSMGRRGSSPDARLGTDVLSVKAIAVDLSTSAAVQDGKQPNAGKRESHRE